jgi:hypothetical protein
VQICGAQKVGHQLELLQSDERAGAVVCRLREARDLIQSLLIQRGGGVELLALKGFVALSRQPVLRPRQRGHREPRRDEHEGRAPAMT